MVFSNTIEEVSKRLFGKSLGTLYVNIQYGLIWPRKGCVGVIIRTNPVIFRTNPVILRTHPFILRTN